MPGNYICVDTLGEPLWKEAPTEIDTELYPVAVWRTAVYSFVPYLKYLQTLLQPLEKERAMRYQQESDRQQRIIGKAVLRILLGKYAGIDPKEIRFRSDRNKKPVVENTIPKALHFNVSHSGDWILIALSANEIGIDIEQMNASFTWQNMLSFSFSPPEIVFIEQSFLPDQSFYRLWTRKECLLKATGKGLVDELPLVPSLDGLHQNPIQITQSAENWQVTSFKVDENHVGSVAFCPVKTALQFFNFRL